MNLRKDHKRKNFERKKIETNDDDDESAHGARMHGRTISVSRVVVAPVALSTSKRIEKDRAYYFFFSPFLSRVPGDGLKMYAR